MNNSNKKTLQKVTYENLDALEWELSKNLEAQLSDLEYLAQEHDKIGTPEGLGETIEKVVYEQFLLTIGIEKGEEFLIENKGMTLDLRDKAHIQTTDNFEKGKIASHNTEIDYQERYDSWQGNFARDEQGNIKTYTSRSGRTEKILVPGARSAFDNGRPTGSKEKGTDMDHTISAAEIIRDAEANAHLTKEQQITFANSDKNLHEMNNSWNRSKKDTPMQEWLDNPNSKGQKPHEIFDITKKDDKILRKKDQEAREEYQNLKAEGEKVSIETGKKSQRQEAVRISKSALRAVVLTLLAEFLRTIIKKLIAWFKSGEKNIKTFIQQFKESWKEFYANL